MKIGLIDVDGHHFPNLALMRISAFHKSIGDEVEWYFGEMTHYDIVYMSKIFSSSYSKDVPEPMNADSVIKGGTGYAISLVDGKEVFDQKSHPVLPDYIEHQFPDYSIYPQYDFAVSMTSRGCPRGCPFCIVKSKEGQSSKKVADVKDFWNGQNEIKVLDPNITACPDKSDLFEQYIETNAMVDFTQGLDIRLLTEDDISSINRMKIKNIHFAWDNPKENLYDKFKYFASHYKRKSNGCFVYVLTNFNSSMEENLERIYKLREMKYKPYVMIYNKPSAPLEIRRLQAWCNNKIVFNSVPNFYDMRWNGNTLTKITKGEHE